MYGYMGMNLEIHIILSTNAVMNYCCFINLTQTNTLKLVCAYSEIPGIRREQQSVTTACISFTGLSRKLPY